MPSFVSCHTRDSVRRSDPRGWAACGIAIPATMHAENKNVPASSEQGERLRLRGEARDAPPARSTRR